MGLPEPMKKMRKTMATPRYGRFGGSPGGGDGAPGCLDVDVVMIWYLLGGGRCCWC